MVKVGILVVEDIPCHQATHVPGIFCVSNRCGPDFFGRADFSEQPIGIDIVYRFPFVSETYRCRQTLAAIYLHIYLVYLPLSPYISYPSHQDVSFSKAAYEALPDDDEIDALMEAAFEFD